MFELNANEKDEIEDILSGIRSDEHVLEMKKYIQHGQFSTYSHCENVAAASYVLNRLLHTHADMDILLKGASLHDFYLYDWHDGSDKSHRGHGFIHAEIAAGNAEKYFHVDDRVLHVIRCHMWPLNISMLPRSREAWLVCLADKLVSLYETVLKR